MVFYVKYNFDFDRMFEPFEVKKRLISRKNQLVKTILKSILDLTEKIGTRESIDFRCIILSRVVYTTRECIDFRCVILSRVPIFTSNQVFM